MRLHNTADEKREADRLDTKDSSYFRAIASKIGEELRRRSDVTEPLSEQLTTLLSELDKTSWGTRMSQQILMYGVQREATKMQTNDARYGGFVSHDFPKKRFKLISVEYNNPDMPDLAIVEFVGEGATTLHGVWHSRSAPSQSL